MAGSKSLDVTITTLLELIPKLVNCVKSINHMVKSRSDVLLRLAKDLIAF
jgi:hypothetical protein